MPLKLIAGAVLIAAVFIVAAILGGGGGGGFDGAAPPVGGSPETTERTEAEPPTASQSTSDLGYPAFATKNTTRVGGSDPTADAAGAALAVFPSATDAQRPEAVS